VFYVTELGKQLMHKNIQQDAKIYQNFIFPVYMKLNMFRATHPPIIRSLKLHWQSLVYHTSYNLPRMINHVEGCWTCDWWKLSGLTTSTYHKYNNLLRIKTRGCQCSFRLLMMGSVSSETC
jgi:hypothetical protein